MQRQQHNNHYNLTYDCKQSYNDNNTTMITAPHMTVNNHTLTITQQRLQPPHPTVNNHAFKRINNSFHSELRMSTIFNKYLQQLT